MGFQRFFPQVLVILLIISATLVHAGDFVSSEVSLTTPLGDLYGTLLAPPEGSAPVPVILLIAGSGPTDRDGNTAIFPGKNNSLLQIAEGLANSGIASLRYDKRGVAASAGSAISEWQMRFSYYIDDARRWCDQLSASQQFSAVVVAGHSEGSLVGMNAAWQAGADGFASMAGAGRSLCDVLRSQLRTQLAIQSRVQAEKVLSELEQGRVVEEPPIGLSILFRPSVQPYLISWQQYNPVRDIARLQIPVLIVQGTTDIQVSVEDAQLLAKGRPDASVLMLAGYNHIFKAVAGKNPMEHQLSLVDSTLEVSSELVPALVQLAKDSEQAATEKQKLLDVVNLFNLGLAPIIDAENIDEFLTAQSQHPIAENVGFWARYFVDRHDIVYCFGPNDGGYVAQGSLVLDGRQDCVSLVYRCSELARSANQNESVEWALKTRFAGAPLASFVGDAGNVDYDHPAHLDYSLDMIRSGNWGLDITTSLSGVTVDEAGTSRYPAGSFSYVSQDSLVSSELSEGDVIWLVFDAANKKAAKVRDEYGLVIGHLGMVIMEDGEPWLVHAASNELPDYYQGGTVVKVPLAIYLERVEKFSGFMVTRFMQE